MKGCRAWGLGPYGGGDWVGAEPLLSLDDCGRVQYGRGFLEPWPIGSKGGAEGVTKRGKGKNEGQGIRLRAESGQCGLGPDQSGSKINL